MILTNINSRIMIIEVFSNNFLYNRGLRQGDPLSTDVFNIVLAKIIKGADIQTTRHNLCRRYSIADKIKKQFGKTFQSFEEEAKKYGLVINK